MPGPLGAGHHSNRVISDFVVEVELNAAVRLSLAGFGSSLLHVADQGVPRTRSEPARRAGVRDGGDAGPLGGSHDGGCAGGGGGTQRGCADGGCGPSRAVRAAVAGRTCLPPGRPSRRPKRPHDPGFRRTLPCDVTSEGPPALQVVLRAKRTAPAGRTPGPFLSRRERLGRHHGRGVRRLLLYRPGSQRALVAGGRRGASLASRTAWLRSRGCGPVRWDLGLECGTPDGS
jgi:hypothetical protein